MDTEAPIQKGKGLVQRPLGTPGSGGQGEEEEAASGRQGERRPGSLVPEAHKYPCRGEKVGADHGYKKGSSLLPLTCFLLKLTFSQFECRQHISVVLSAPESLSPPEVPDVLSVSAVLPALRGQAPFFTIHSSLLPDESGSSTHSLTWPLTCQ